MDHDDGSSVDSSHRDDIESPPDTESCSSSEQEEAAAITKRNSFVSRKRRVLNGARSSSTLASEKDPRSRHTGSTRSSISRRSSLRESYSTRTTISSGAAGSVQLPPTQVLEDIDLEEEGTETTPPMYGECDTFGWAPQSPVLTKQLTVGRVFCL